MNANPAQQSNQFGDPNYVDAYTPPDQPALSSSSPGTPPAETQQHSSANQPINDASSAASVQAAADSSQAQPTQIIQDVSHDANSSIKSESLEDQNIFFLLGVRDGTDQEKESFLDELQQVIWEDFLEYDVKLLITSDEMVELQKMLNSQTDRDLEKQEKIIIYLEKLIPDLEEIMLEKALELKEEMVRERANGLRQYYADKPDKLQRVDEAEKLMDSNQWYTAAHLMNSLGNS